MSPVLLWFRRDLRLHDNPALQAAAEAGRSVVPVYISDELDTLMAEALKAYDEEFKDTIK